VWRFKEKQWVKVPGTNRRQPRARNAAEVIVQQRPELRIIDQKLWDAVQARLAMLKAKYTGGRQKGGLTFKRAPYLLSGILACSVCGAPMTMEGGTSARYYRCQTYKKKRLCSNDRSVREDLARTKILTAIRDHLLSPEGIAHSRKRVAEELRDYSNKLAADLRDRPGSTRPHGRKDARPGRFHRDRRPLGVRGLHPARPGGVHAPGARSAGRVGARVARAAALPSIEEVCAQVADLDVRLAQDPEAGREPLRRWLNDGAIRIGRTKTVPSLPRARFSR
jgi:hypothetical protein